MQQEHRIQQEQITLPIGSVVRTLNGDRYIVEALLGKGGSSAVYRVRDRHNKQDIFAIKELIDPDILARERFAFEAETLMHLDHEALPRVYRVFENEKLRRVYILMDYIEGQDLETLRQEQPNNRFSLHLVLALLTPIISALNYLHHREPPIVHRDLKPANIVVPIKGGDAMLVDFGIAKEYVDDGTTTVIRHGSPGYAALEQYGSGTNIRTDVYGLGATLYTLLTGTIPIDALTRVSASHGVDPLKPAHMLVPELPEGVSGVISSALSISRDDRFATIAEFWDELNVQVEAESEITAKVAIPTPHTPRIKKDIAITTLLEQRQMVQIKKRHTGLFISASLASLLVGTSIAAFLVRMPHAPSHVVVHKTVYIAPTATPTIDQAPYPTLASSYIGETNDLLNGKKTALSLTKIQQKQSTLHGSFAGLGLAGSLNGTIGVSGNIAFIINIPGRDTGISFIGNVKTGGDLAGEFYVINVSSGQHTGEYGSWTLIQA